MIYGDIENNNPIAKKIERHEQDIIKLNKAVFGNPCLKLFLSLGNIVLTIIVYLKAFEVIDKNGKLI